MGENAKSPSSRVAHQAARRLRERPPTPVDQSHPSGVEARGTESPRRPTPATTDFGRSRRPRPLPAGSTTRPPHPAVVRRRLIAELRRLRRERTLSLRAIGEQLGWADPVVIRVQRGFGTRHQTRQLLTLLGGADLAAELMRLYALPVPGVRRSTGPPGRRITASRRIPRGPNHPHPTYIRVREPVLRH
jgi:hypothetical protein